MMSGSLGCEAMESVLDSLTFSHKYEVPLQVGMQCMSPSMNANLYYFLGFK